MISLLRANGISFMDVELVVFQKLRQAFVEVMESVLVGLDEMVFGNRDRERYVVKDRRSGCIASLMGDIEYKRRYYLDKDAGEYVFLLDELLEIEAGRASPGLAMAAVLQAVTGPSYRAARDNLKRFYGHQVASHEWIRQMVLDTWEQIKSEEEKRRAKAEGARKVDILFVEADGYWCSMQREKRRKREVRMAVSHEGWAPRSPGSKEYELCYKSHFLDLDSSDFWDDASRHLMSRYDLGEDTVVVINGDRASWIRAGVGYFPRALYQVDRFHIKRDIRRLLHNTRELATCLDAFDRSDIDGLIDSLAAARERAKATSGDVRRIIEIDDLMRSVMEMPRAYVDYRIRLREMGYDTAGMRGMGAAESNVDRFSNRLKKRGQSWGLEGLKAMANSLIKHFEGKLERYAKHVGRVHALLQDHYDADKISDIADQVVGEVEKSMQGNVPIMRSGRTRSGGLSRLFNNIVDQGLIMT